MKKLLLHLFIVARWLLYGTIIQCFSITLLMANTGNAQNIKSVREHTISVDFQNDDITDVFSKIEKSTEYHFVYDKSVIKQNHTFSKTFNHSTVAQILVELSGQYDLRFRQIDQNIV